MDKNETSPQATGEMTVTHISFPQLSSLWSLHRQTWQWNTPFVTPAWLTAWWTHFADKNELLLLKVCFDNRPVGVAPLMLKDSTATFIGSTDLCDLGDFIVEPGFHSCFYQAILDYLHQHKIHHLVLEQVQPGSHVYKGFCTSAQENGWHVSISQQSASVQMDLPADWSVYLQNLDKKQRHEVRRKLRRVSEAGVMGQHVVKDVKETPKAMNIFFDLFRQSRNDKKEFMTPEKEAFFRTLASELAKADMLHLLSLSIDNEPAAAVFCVENNNSMFLYNNGYNSRFKGISIGTVCKILSIMSSIESGKKVYDFLGGTERYKFQLGGTEVPLFSCTLRYNPTTSITSKQAR